VPPSPIPRGALSLLRGLRSLPFTVGFGLILAVAEIGYSVLSSRRAERVAAWASTNVARLRTEPLGPLAASVFVIEDYRLMWLVLGVLGCALVEVRLGWRRTLLVAVGAQLGGTAVSEGIVWWRVDHGLLPDSALHQLDVGASYVAVGLLTAALLVGRPFAARIIAALSLAVIAPNLLSGLNRLDVSPVGHVTAFVIAGIFVGVFIVRDNRQRRI